MTDKTGKKVKKAEAGKGSRNRSACKGYWQSSYWLKRAKDKAKRSKRSKRTIDL